MRLPRGGLYGITDTGYKAKTHLEAARIFLEGGSRIIQYRRKSGPTREMIEEARAVGRLCRDHGALLIVDDRVDVAVLADADGVHVGAEDAPVDEVRARFGGLIVGGASASSVEEAVDGGVRRGGLITWAPGGPSSPAPRSRTMKCLDWMG